MWRTPNLCEEEPDLMRRAHAAPDPMRRAHAAAACKGGSERPRSRPNLGVGFFLFLVSLTEVGN